LAALLVAAVVVSQSGAQGSTVWWVALLQKRVGGNLDWSRLPAHGQPTLWHEEPKSAKASDGWGRLPEQHKARIRHLVPAKKKHHTTLQHELPAVYHLPSQPGVYSKVSEADRHAAEKLARNLHSYHSQAMGSKKGHLAQRVERRKSVAHLRKEEKSLPAGFHILKPGQKLPKGARIVKAALIAGYHVLKPAGMKLPQITQIVAHPPQLATRRGAMRRSRMNVPRVGMANHMLDEEAAEGVEDEGSCDCEEGDEDCECPEEMPRVVNITVVEPTADERMQIAFATHRASRVERIKARELKNQVQALCLVCPSHYNHVCG